jgi:hypothetical protein
MPKTRTKNRTQKQQRPQLVPLRYGTVYCELCRRPVNAGDRVAWWKVTDDRGRNVSRSRRWRSRWTAYCADCHHANVKQGSPLR